MNAIPPFDVDLLRRHDRPGPRYTSYPTAPQFGPGFGEAEFRAAVHRSNEDPIPRPLSLYLHVPYCHSPCFYCGCNRVITRDGKRGAIYVARLLLEIERVAPLFDGDRLVNQIHFGGGTPNFLGTAQLGEVMRVLGTRFSFSETADRDFSIELDPRFISPDGVADLAAIGFNRASLGVQDFDPDVQQAVNRIQGVEETLAIVQACRTHGLRSVNIDLIYGLPRQTLAGFGRTLDTVLAVRPDRLAVYGYAHLPSLFKPQRQIKDAQLPGPPQKLALLQLAIEKLSAAGYVYIGMDHFALPGEDLAVAQLRGSLHRNFMGYTTHAESDLVGLGVSAISHIGDSYSQNPRELSAWEAAIDRGALPVWRGIELGEDDVIRADVIQAWMCHGRLDTDAIQNRWGIRFRHYFAPDLERLEPLIADGLVLRTTHGYQATDRGRLLMRIIAMCFDRYLHQGVEPDSPRFSRAI